MERYKTRRHLYKGIFIALEGGEASGKSTQIKELENILVDRGYKVTTSREPGGTELSERIRDVIMSSEMNPNTELLLYLAARQDNYLEIIKPALQAGHIVIVDRYHLSTLVYQGIAIDREYNDIQRISNLAINICQPDINIFIDIPVEMSQSRKSNVEDINRFDTKKSEFHSKVRDGYHHLANNSKHKIETIDGTQTKNQITEEILEIITRLIEDKENE